MGAPKQCLLDWSATSLTVSGEPDSGDEAAVLRAWCVLQLPHPLDGIPLWTMNLLCGIFKSPHSVHPTVLRLMITVCSLVFTGFLYFVDLPFSWILHF